MVRETSLEAYNYIKESGILSKRRMEVYEYLFHNGPATAQQVYRALSNMANPSSYLGRLCELRRMGAVQELDKVICKYTGRNVILWDVTKDKPVVPPKEKSLKKRYQELLQYCQRLEEENSILRKELHKDQLEMFE